MYPLHWEKKPENKHWWPQAFQIGPLNLQHMKAQTYCNTTSTISQAWSSGWLLLNVILCLMVSTCKRTILLFKKKKINCPQQSTYSVLGKYGLNILLHKANREQRGWEESTTAGWAFHYSHQMFLVAKFKWPCPSGLQDYFCQHLPVRKLHVCKKKGLLSTKRH